MALEIKGLQRIFKFRKDSKELVLSKHSINSPFHSKNVILLL